MSATTTEPLARLDEIGIETEAIVGALLAAGIVGHVALGVAALTFLAGVLPALL
ncbi:hypothetical protein Hbl1158_13640 [Halobaculum sp. CBA1158]|uniref:hypothetical protein n=1 Tax=Halobaculum sp. CBA1158 TaxID=2904243 RepID=UPI001F324CC7|nr:hypothetical protein [Halobaculum sp. CBA1158]UIO99551.1 hypothetical protein Hbl1158_13640 [Halobaculum sp. CBA1158]